MRINIRPSLNSIIVSVLLFVLICTPAFAAERSETEALVREITPPISVLELKPEKKDQIVIDSYYEGSDIIQGSRTGHWTEFTNHFGYSHNNVYGYMVVSEYERFDNKDYYAGFGAYFNFPKSYVHAEAGFSWDIDYLYKFQSITEYGRNITDGLFWQVGYNYRAYGTDDVHLIYPGLIYYFGDSYINADWGTAFMEGHDTAYFGTVKGSFAVTKFLQWWGGVSVGERLYDIFELDAHEEFGYALFTGLTFNVYKGVSIRGGYSYGTEEPKFIKRSLNFAVSVKF